jgi:ribosomal protein S2
MRTENYYIDYRYIPGSLGNSSSLDNGAIMRESRRTSKAAQRLIARLKSDPQIQWARCSDQDLSRSDQTYGGRPPNT